MSSRKGSFLLPQFQILLVDDLEADAQTFQEVLKEVSLRARAYWVASGAEAIEFLHRRGRFREVGPVQIVVLDLHLPGDDGLSILRTIKSNPDLNRIPVIMLSSSNAQPEIDLAYSLGANAFFRKPMTLSGYLDLVRVLTKHWLDMVRLPSAIGGLGRSFASESERERTSEDL